MRDRIFGRSGRGDTSRDFIDHLYKPLLSRKARRRNGVPPGALIIGHDPITHEPVYFLHDDLKRSLDVIGGPRSGKSNFLRNFDVQLLLHKVRTGDGFAVIDTHGTLARNTRNVIASRFPQFCNDLVYLDLQQTSKVIGFNPLARATDENAFYVAQCMTEAIIKACGARASQDLPSITRVLSHLGEALAYTGMTLPDMEFFLYRTEQNLAVFRHLLERLPATGPTRAARMFWEDFAQKTKQSQEAQTEGPLNRLSRLTRPQEFRRILSAPSASLNIQEIMDRGGIALFDLSAPPGTNVSLDGQSMMAALLVQEFNQAWPNRNPDTARPFVLIMDEFGDYVSGDVARIITGAPKFKLWCVYSHQNLSQLIDRDGDKELLYTVLGIPNKVVFGNLYIDEAEVIAKPMYLAALNPDKVKHVVRSIVWDPVPTKVTLRGWSRSGGRAQSDGTSETIGHSAGSNQSRSSDSSNPEKYVVSEGASAADVQTHASQHNFTIQQGWSEDEKEAWTTFYNKRVQEGAVSYETIDEQVFRHAQSLALAPVGQAAVSQLNRVPQVCSVPHVQDLDFTDDQIRPFLNALYEGKNGALYLDRREVDQFLRDRERALLEAAPAEPRVVKSEEQHPDRPRLRRR